MFLKSKNIKGFSLVESMIGLAVMAAVSMGAIKLFVDQSKDQKGIEVNYEITGELEKIKEVLSSEENCTESFRNLPANGGSVTDLKSKMAGSFVGVHQVNVLQPSNLSIMSYVLDTTATGLSSDELVLRIKFSRGKAAKKEEVHKVVRLNYTASAGNIVSCFAYSDSSVFWKRSEVNANSIYYNKGKIGIGKSRPRTVLDVSGHVKLGANGACTAEKEGSIAFDTTTEKMIFCDGTNWTSSSTTDEITFHAQNCNTGGTGRVYSINMGIHKSCFLSTVTVNNMGRDDHTRTRCTITKVGQDWNLEIRCREANTQCRAVCSR